MQVGARSALDLQGRHAAEGDPYTNRLYAHLGQPIARAKNRRGDTHIVYANTIDALLANLARDRSRRIQAFIAKGGDTHDLVAVSFVK